jgi:hypothetical protein
MEFLVYRSVPRVAPRSSEARAIVATSVRNNARDGLTGFLHHEPDLFVQYLEGPGGPLAQLWARIAADTRHEAPTIIGKGLIAHRFFADWRMGYSHGDVACFLDFLGEATGKTLLAQASVRETIWFLRGACQRLDLGLVR